MPSHAFHGPEDHTQTFETEDLEDSEPGESSKGPGTKRGEKKNGTPSDSPNNTKVSPSLLSPEMADGWKENEPTLPERWKSKDSNYPARLETQLDQLRMKWTGSSYEIILEKLEMLKSWQEEGNEEVKEAIIEWMITNDVETLVEEGEDILDGLETMESLGEVSDNLLLDSTELITSIIVARRMETDQELPAFQKDGNEENAASRNISRISRASSMIKIREELLRRKELRKPVSSRMVMEDDFKDLEVKRVSRKSQSRSARGVLSADVENELVQDRGSKIQVVGSDVEALYPTLDAVEVAQIVYNVYSGHDNLGEKPQ